MTLKASRLISSSLCVHTKLGLQDPQILKGVSDLNRSICIAEKAILSPRITQGTLVHSCLP